MPEKVKIYKNTDLSIDGLSELFGAHDVSKIYYKKLSANDNSKNQPYMGSHITDLGFLPTGKATISATKSEKTIKQNQKIKYSFSLNFSWLSPDGDKFRATKAKLIYYPQYPEVRLSGFLTGCRFDMDGWMDPGKRGRKLGRVLFLGVTKNQRILAYLATPDSRLAKEVNNFYSVEINGVFNQLKVEDKGTFLSSRDILIAELRRIHLKKWIRGQRLNSDGELTAYAALNGGGYTLEAELGIIPNGYAGPDFMGWEIKQFGVKRCDLIGSKILTLMTPEPDGGYYVEHGVESFVRRYGYDNAKIADRKDFTGRHIFEMHCKKTKLVLKVNGFDSLNGVITDASGKIVLVDGDGVPASSWSFTKLMDLWKRKHSKAAYVPSILKSNNAANNSYYYYCNNIRLFEGTSFTKFLSSVVASGVYYDPGIKLEDASTNPKTKRRSQFRVKSKLLASLYNTESVVDVLK